MPLVNLPSAGTTIYLNSFFPQQHPLRGDDLCRRLARYFVVKALAEYLGTVEVQYVGLAAVTDLRNEIYEKLVRQPIGFFQQQSTGRLMSTVINDVERVRVRAFGFAGSSFFRYVFTLFFLMAVLACINWKMALGSMSWCRVILWPVRTLGRRIRRSVEVSQSRSGRSQPNPAGDSQRQSRGESLWHGAL